MWKEKREERGKKDEEKQEKNLRVEERSKQIHDDYPILILILYSLIYFIDFNLFTTFFEII